MGIPVPEIPFGGIFEIDVHVIPAGLAGPEAAIERDGMGIAEPDIENRAGQLVPNPLLAARAPGQIVVTGIVGVPWQDLATPETLAGSAPLALQSSSALQWWRRRSGQLATMR